MEAIHPSSIILLPTLQLYELNFVPMGTAGAPIWDASNWTYSTAFDLSPSTSAGTDVWLVLDGVKMAADVWVNGQYVGFTADQFLRYTWPVKQYLKPSGNVLTITFTTSLDPRNTEARFMGCTGEYACIECEWLYILFMQ